MNTVASVLVSHFKRWGISHTFGIPGKAIVPILMEIDKQNLRFVLTRHEAGAGFAAAGFALKKNTLGVAIGTSGPGGTNLITAAAQAKAYHSPVLFITGQPSVKGKGKALGQDSSMFGTDMVKLFEPVTLFSASVERSDQVQLLLTHAIEKAFSGSKGPVHLSIPFEVLLEEVQPFSIELPTQMPKSISNNVQQVISFIEHAKRPVLCLGKGVHASHAYEEVRWLAERWNIPVITTPGGKGTFLTNHPLSLGSFGLGGTETSMEYLEDGIDLMIVIGTKLSDMSLAGFSQKMFPTQVIQFDYDQTFIGKSLPVPTLPILGDAKENIRAIMELLLQNNESIKGFSDLKEQKEIKERKEENNHSKFISAAKAIQEIRRHLPEDTVLFGDDGSHSFYAIKYFDIYEPGTFHFDDVFGAMGHAIGYAIGAKLGLPGKTVVCLTGDGCMFMHGAEVSVAVNEEVPVIFVVLNNNSLDMVDKGMKQWLGKAVGSTYREGLQVSQYAEAMGAAAFCCRTAYQIQEAIKCALEYNMPTVIEIMVDPEEIPPILNRVEATTGRFR
ncbi:thiamine pyrophosphate-binding protein [Alkalihalobacillus sp. BA299]|uniref:thiamine pyrophosphate-binding protein n=1 Tax=Alkalihalobacillus sp. BA299 TaxID=2815938 RepID=UPI001ADBC295|nr:thiamine pyrophosphate-binding protein [Alkalihalobacillus sp. BA299]